ncbi:hypothetical protein PSHT_01050 [Puccinia striiformis]|uniref:Uncharacterized protein n=1 Tax=Puccinia striiformis TaxID=27350 RepID=A0A2S4WLH4_9BASI|nr:hypothetical protein PSHT_01050 [Puccinia striiformis]
MSTRLAPPMTESIPSIPTQLMPTGTSCSRVGMWRCGPKQCFVGVTNIKATLTVSEVHERMITPCSSPTT